MMNQIWTGLEKVRIQTKNPGLNISFMPHLDSTDLYLAKAQG
jgi:hypothetical protein